ncbi:hypothetical protein X975_17472, partial [Stegodyphus mimosarum]
MTHTRNNVADIFCHVNFLGSCFGSDFFVSDLSGILK